MPTHAEILLDYPAFRAGEIKLAAAPEKTVLVGGPVMGDAPVVWTADVYKRAYHGMNSYESALDAAGYAREADMRAPDAPIFVAMGTIDDDGTLHIATPAFSDSVTAAEIYAAHGLTLPDAAVSMPDDDTPAP